jgi:DNA-binding LacI/PurR family transcriptional regulator
VVLRGESYKFADPYWASVLDGLDAELARHDYNLAFTLSVTELEHSSRRALLSREHADGLVLLGPIPPPVDLFDIARTVLVEGIDEIRWGGAYEVDVITVEKRRSIYQVVEHLAVTGRRRIGFLGPAASRDERTEAFPHALARMNLPIDPALIVESPWATEGAYLAATELLSGAVIPDAVVCASDEIAVGVMQAARERCLRLPEHLAITGFDDLPFAALLEPSLTTVAVPRGAVGVVAAQRVIERIEGSRLPVTTEVLPAKLVVRASSGVREGQ